MRFTRVSSIFITLVAAVAAFASFSCTTTQSGSSAEQAAAAKPDPVERGAYLVTIMGCNDCHTPGYFYGQPDMNRMLSGSEAGWVGPWGTVYSANLTPDQETGLGSWTDDQIITALRTGQRPDGRVLAAIMPWANFSTLTDEDVHAIVAYLRSIPPVSHKPPAPVPPGQKAANMIIFPAPPAWDVPPPGN